MKKRMLSLALAVVFVFALLCAGCSGGGKEITITVVHADQSTKDFTYETDAEMLGEVLLEEGLVEGDETEYGLMITVVDGEQAIYETDGAYWSLLIDGEYAQTGVDATPIEDGDSFSLVYTLAE